jgi:hypothetical protein
MSKVIPLPTRSGRIVNVTLGHSFQLRPRTRGLTRHDDDGQTTILLKPDILASARFGDHAALRTVLHEIGHAMLHQAVLRGERTPSQAHEDEADLFADAVLAAIS